MLDKSSTTAVNSDYGCIQNKKYTWFEFIRIFNHLKQPLKTTGLNWSTGLEFGSTKLQTNILNTHQSLFMLVTSPHTLGINLLGTSSPLKMSSRSCKCPTTAPHPSSGIDQG
jgi:hypothetical protein